MKKGQTNILIPIMIAIVIVITLTVIIKAITMLNKENIDSSFFDFEIELRNAVNNVKNSREKTTDISAFFPPDITALYIFDQSKSYEALSFQESPFLNDEFRDVKENVFLMKGIEIIHSFKLNELDINSPHYVCVKNMNNKAELRFIGTDNGADINVKELDMDCTVPAFVREIVTELNGSLDQDKFDEELREYSEALRKIAPTEIEREFSYNPYEDKTTIKLRFRTEASLNSFRYFEYIPKCLSLEFSSFRQEPHGNERRVKVDPIIMWHFSHLNAGDEISTNYSNERKLSEICQKMTSSFGIGRGEVFTPLGHVTGIPFLISTGLEGGEISPYVDYDKDGRINALDEYPDDRDDDSFPDSWEREHNFDLEDADSPGANQDNDGDGLPNNREYDFGTDPKDEDSDDDGASDYVEVQWYTNALNPDTDGDGMPDGWEILFGLDPLNDDSAQDGDNDYLSNIDEYGYGTDPTDEDSDDDYLLDGIEVVLGLSPVEPDSDGDTVIDGLDAFPLNENEQEDTDNDGAGNNIDPDDDNDGIPDEDDLEPTCNQYTCIGCDPGNCPEGCERHSITPTSSQLFRQFRVDEAICAPRGIIRELGEGDPTELITCSQHNIPAQSITAEVDPYTYKIQQCENDQTCQWCFDYWGGSCVPASYGCGYGSCRTYGLTDGSERTECYDRSQHKPSECINTANKVKIFECRQDSCTQTESIDCPGGCNNGACVEQDCNSLSREGCIENINCYYYYQEEENGGACYDITQEPPCMLDAASPSKNSCCTTIDSQNNKDYCPYTWGCYRDSEDENQCKYCPGDNCDSCFIEISCTAIEGCLWGEWSNECTTGG
ncbi:hypothetical protein JW930_00030 [Candidatus Woesearchaeota archaeon]|nr:hypothetical protein [Candidatus Woesearchaeota archaeon]